jgi:hypothetical protein
MMYKAKVAVCSEIHTKHLMQSEHHVVWMLNLVVCKYEGCSFNSGNYLFTTDTK